MKPKTTDQIPQRQSTPDELKEIRRMISELAGDAPAIPGLPAEIRTLIAGLAEHPWSRK